MTNQELKLLSEIERLKLELLKEQEKNAALDLKYALLKEKNLLLNRMIFGRRSEKRLPIDPKQLTIQFEPKAVLDEEKKPFNTVVEEIQIESHKRRINKAKEPKTPTVRLPETLERRDVVIEPQGLDLSQMEKIGQDVREVLEYTPGSFYVKRIIRPKYKAKNNTALETKIYQASAYESFIAKSYAGDSILSELIIGKYIDHLPVYRQVEMFKRNGMKLSYSTLNSWVHQVASQLYPLYETLSKQALSSDYIQVDETTLPVVKDEKHKAVKAYLWGVHDVVNKQLFFHYDKGSRAQQVVVSLLKNYQGNIQTDGYEAYSIYEDKQGVTLLGCWAHVRRKFEQALNEDENNANKALDFISLLYQIEANLSVKQLPPEQIAHQRQQQSYIIIQNFELWLKDLYINSTITPKSLMGKAISYTFSLLIRLSRYIQDGRLLIDNNRIESLIRPIALGRKNYLFCDNDDTARNTALFYSFFGSCKLVGINPKDWMLDVLGRIKDTKNYELVNLLPKNWIQQ